MKFTGKVIKGDGRGRKLGFPTLNLKTSLILEDGVYIARADGLASVMHVGRLPTFSIDEKRVEIHVLDVDDDWYGREVTVEVFDKIREVEKFDSVKSLVKAIEGDVKKAREFFCRVGEM